MPFLASYDPADIPVTAMKKLALKAAHRFATGTRLLILRLFTERISFIQWPQFSAKSLTYLRTSMIFLRGQMSAIALALLHTLYFITSVSSKRADTHKIKWHDTGKGSIAIEEAWTIPELSVNVPEAGLTVAELNSDLFDIYDQRLTRMDENGVDFMALSCSSPCIQGISDPATAESMAISLNNQLAAQIYNDVFHPNITGRFGAFAALSMHNASAAAVELRRACTRTGIPGSTDTLLFFYQPEYDVFWETVTELDVPVYFHPRNNIAPISTLFYNQVPWLKGPAQEFSATLSTHVLGLCHMGERIPSDLDRIDKSLAEQKSNGMPMLLNVSTYFHTNIWETCSGSFNPSLLEFHRKEIGLERMMYSIDYPFVQMEDGKAFLNELEEGRVLTREEMRQFTRETAIGLLKLNE
ncbi:hypothetical protein BT96DRAFT_971371 [Gymnopus androsaceus JB14]|uniref:Amidohydrolase-related domain-containing protein n=1 Tax=Gymnopus androsaceus JB14 TaxID=1447944 RepID=A0A6A4IF37_9AGAR|nr:hypothetical protein BT96DRAFT_971371 [Gymnopus androsaceus JB14]